MWKRLSIYRTVIIGYTLLAGGAILVLLSLLQLPYPLREALRVLGTSLLPASLVGLVYEHFLRKSFAGELKEQVREVVQSEFGPVQRLAAAGLADAFPKMPTSSVTNSISLASRRVRILQTWIPDLIEFEQALVPAIKNGATIQFLLMNPGSIHARIRSKELGYQDDQAAPDAARSTLSELTRFCGESKITTAVEVRLFDETPTTSMYFVDDTVVLGWFWKRQMCIQGPHIEVRGAQSTLYREMDRYFGIVWDGAHLYDLARASPGALHTQEAATASMSQTSMQQNPPLQPTGSAGG